jgi:hypothetical protein
MRGARSSIAGVCLLAVVLAAARAEEGAPLESTKKQLRELESVQKDKAGTVPGAGLKLDTPTLHMPDQGAESTQQWRKARTEEEQKREQKKRDADNWLVNGVDKLGHDEAKTGSKDNDATALLTQEAATKDAMIDTSDPQYLLKTFDDQKKRSDSKQAEITKGRTVPAGDPFAPFLQDWLGNSPVRDQVMDQFLKRGDSGPTVGPVTGASDFRTPGAGSAVVSTPSPREPAAAAKPNPYLTNLNTPTLSPDTLSGGPAPAATVGIPLSGGEVPKAPAAVSPLDPLPDSRTPAKGPPPGFADDKKYFPQLKKF